MIFTQFIALLEDVKQLLNEIHDVAWKPNQVADFKGVRGITSDPATTRLDRRVDVDHDQYQDQLNQEEKPKMAQPKQGDIVIVRDQAGNHTPGVVVSIQGGQATIVNNVKKMTLTRPVDKMGLAPPAMTQTLNKGAAGAGRTVWMIS